MLVRRGWFVAWAYETASPRGLTALDDGRLLIAEVGGGRLLILDRQNRLAVLHEGLPRLKDGPEGAPAGVSAAVQLGGITYYVVGEARVKEFREVSRWRREPTPSV